MSSMTKNDHKFLGNYGKLKKVFEFDTNKIDNEIFRLHYKGNNIKMSP